MPRHPNSSRFFDFVSLLCFCHPPCCSLFQLISPNYFVTCVLFHLSPEYHLYACLLPFPPPGVPATMGSPLVNTLAKALPSACRQCQFRASPHIIRSFSSSPSARAGDKFQTRAAESKILGTSTEPPGAKDSTFGVLEDVMREGSGGRQSRDVGRMAHNLQSEFLSDPYGERAPPHHMHVFARRHNTHITLTRPNGEPMLSLSSGNLGFRKTNRGGYDPAYQLTAYFFSRIHDKGLLVGIKRLELVFRDFAQGRDAFIKVLLGNEGRAIRGLVSRVTDSTRIKFGGTKSRHVRRLG